MPETPAELTAFGWEISEATLAGADSELRLVTHWFLTPEDTSVNRDDHFGSDDRTLRFLAVALPTLMHQLGARLAVVSVPWGLETGSPSLTVIGLGSGRGSGRPVGLQTRALRRLTREPGPPFWRLEPGPVAAPERLAGVARGLER